MSVDTTRLSGQRTRTASLDLLLDIITAPYDALGWLTDQILLFVRDLFDRFGVPIVFFAALAEATIGLGIVFPGVLVMFLGGANAAADWPEVLLVWGIAVLGTMIGDTVSYSAGRWGGDRLQTTRFGPQLRMGAALIEGRGRWLIPFYHLHNITRAVGPFGAGALRMPLRVWMPLDYLGAAIANTAWVGAGVVFGTAVLTDEGKLEEHPLLRIGLAVLAAAWFLVVQRAFQRRMEELRREATERAAEHEAAFEAAGTGVDDGDSAVTTVGRSE